MESKIIEYGIILLLKYKVEQTEGSEDYYSLFTHKLQEHLVRWNKSFTFPNTFSCFLHSYIRSIGNIHPIMF